MAERNLTALVGSEVLDSTGAPAQRGIAVLVRGAHIEALVPEAQVPAEATRVVLPGTTLLPGTVILTGTPSGVGMSRTPPEFLKHGDSVEIEISGAGVSLGVLRNVVQEEGRIG